MKQEIEQIKTADLVPYARNAKKHDESQVAKIAGSIREFGFNNPVLIDADNGIIAGHGRVMAAQKLGLASVPCLRLSHLSETQKRAYILADNRLAELGGGWDGEMLKLELADLGDLNVDLDGIGFGLRFKKSFVVFVGKLGINRQPNWLSIFRATWQFDGKVNAVFAARTRCMLRRILIWRHHLL